MEKLPLKLALLADIHGNLSALRAVLRDVDRLGVAAILVAGDHIGDCPQPNEVLDLLEQRGTLAVLGNRGADVLAYWRDELPGWDAFAQMASMRWTAKALVPKACRYLAGLLEQCVYDTKTSYGSIRLVHGSPLHIHELLYKDACPERVERALAAIPERILVCGHTHEPWHRWLDDKLIINPGAVGVHFNPAQAAEYAILTVGDTACRVEHFHSAYDVAELFGQFKRSGLDAAGGIWTRTIKQSLLCGRNLSMDFINHAMRVAHSAGPDGQHVLAGRHFISDVCWQKATELWDAQH
jgi:predicted phosphodiesterase